VKAVIAGAIGCALGLGAGVVIVGPSPAVDDRIERYCRLRDRSLGDTLAALETPGGDEAIAKHLLAALEHRYAYDDLMRCRRLDLARYRRCVAAGDHACVVEVIRAAREP
jgi:hypothetical protein